MMKLKTLMQDLVYHILSRMLAPYIGRIDGLKNFPKKGGFVVVCNHASNLDSLVIYYLLRKFRVGRFDYFANKRYVNHPFGLFYAIYEPQLIDQTLGLEKGSNLQAYQNAVDELKLGWAFCIFPEGGRTRDGHIRRGKTGAIRVALKARVPIVPIGINGSFQVMPVGSFFLRKCKIDFSIGKPIHLDKYYSAPPSTTSLKQYEKNKKMYRSITTNVMKEVARLSGQRYEFDQ